MTKNILVTGSEGSLGQALIDRLVKEGHNVTGVDNLSRYGKRTGHTKESYDFVQTDLTDPAACRSLVHNQDIIYQGAATIFGVGGFNQYCADILSKDVILQTNMLRAAANNPKLERFVYISSSMVYEGLDHSDEYLLDSPTEYRVPFTDYGLSKYMGERLCKSFFRQYRVPYTIWRPFNIITPWEKVTTDDIGTSHVFADFINNLLVKKLNPLPIIGDGSQVRCFTWIDDVADAIVKHSTSNSTLNEHFNLGRAEWISMRGLAEEIYRLGIERRIINHTGDLRFETVKSYDGDVKTRIVSVNKAKTLLGWEAPTPFQDSLVKCIDALVVNR